jgi:hypothetical protein
VTLLPALSVPDAGATISSPSRLAGSEIDHETGPPLAVSVSDPPSSGLSSTVVGDTDSVPALCGPPAGGAAVTAGGPAVAVAGAPDPGTVA